MQQRIFTVLTPEELAEALAVYVGKKRNLPLGVADNWTVTCHNAADTINQVRVEFDFEEGAILPPNISADRP